MSTSHVIHQTIFSAVLMMAEMTLVSNTHVVDGMPFEAVSCAKY
jgi:hypothetical protein